MPQCRRILGAPLGPIADGCQPEPAVSVFCGAAPSRRPSRLSKIVGLRRAVPTSSGGRDTNPHFDNVMICGPLSVMVVTAMPEFIDWSEAEVGKFYRPPKKPACPLVER